VVTADCVDVWGHKEKWVRVLLEGDTTTLLKSGYDRKLGTIIFTPMPHDRINMIKTEIQERKDRIENVKDVLAQIVPFVVVGVSMLALVIVAYFMAQAGIKIAELNVEAAGTVREAMQEDLDTYLKTQGFVLPEDEEEDRVIKPIEEIPP
jgi:hypothetical protein